MPFSHKIENQWLPVQHLHERHRIERSFFPIKKHTTHPLVGLALLGTLWYGRERVQKMKKKAKFYKNMVFAHLCSCLVTKLCVL